MRTGTLMALTLMASTGTAADDFPYTAYSVSDDVYVRSGPGRDYYPTDKLQRGDAVEVWRHDPGGWFAIRPPEGSFSWVSSRYVDDNGDGIGTVSDQRVVARVGSRFSRVRDVIQVRLQKGEAVEILESHNAGGQTWYKIAPPAGEFRWVSARFLSKQPQPDGLSAPHDLRPVDLDGRDPAGSSNRPVEAAARNTATAAQGAASGNVPENRPLADRRTVLPPQSLRTAGVSRPPEGGRFIQQEQTKAEPTRLQQAGYAEAARSRATAESASANTSAAGVTATVAASRSFSPVTSAAGQELDLEAELEAIELELAQMLAEEPTVWVTSQLESRCQRLLDQSQTAVERGKVRVVLDKLARLEGIRQRYRTINNVQAQTDRRNALLQQSVVRRRQPDDSFSTAGLQPVSAEQVEADDYDGLGILKPTISRRRDAPRFALVDGEGNIITLVSPAPGINLHPYVGRTVGMTGVRGYMPQWRSPHLSAQRVTVLDAMQR